jgi:hypothetical protein
MTRIGTEPVQQPYNPATEGAGNATGKPPSRELPSVPYRLAGEPGYAKTLAKDRIHYSRPGSGYVAGVMAATAALFCTLFFFGNKK